MGGGLHLRLTRVEDSCPAKKNKGQSFRKQACRAVVFPLQTNCFERRSVHEEASTKRVAQDVPRGDSLLRGGGGGGGSLH